MKIEEGRSLDLLTIIAISLLAYMGVSVVHEAFGHGIACLLLGVTPKGLTSISLDVDWTNVSPAKIIFIGAAGTIANFIAGLIFLWILRQSIRNPISPG